MMIASSALRKNQGLAWRYFVVPWLFVFCHCASSLSIYPHSLSYFNLLAGGPRNGHAHLLDGNLECGQDLLFLEKWIKRHPEARPIHVGYWGFLPLRAVGMNPSQFDFELTDPQFIPKGWYAISVNNLRGDYRVENRKYRSFLARTPVTVIGYTIYVYEITDTKMIDPKRQ